MNSIELSFCIPTYNREQTVFRLVTDILKCTDSSIEVVVLDNGSTDDTLSKLKTIKDSRLLIYSNGENKGALFNMVNVLNKGRGKFLVYSTDQDHIDFTKIGEFKKFLLQQENLAGGFCAFGSEGTINYEIIPQGYQAVSKIAYQGRHPTGYFFNNNLLKSIKLVERFSDYNFVDLFPLEFSFAEICLMGDGAIFYQSIFIPETGAIVVKHKSSTTNGKSKKAFFTPEARLKLAVNYGKHINTLPLSQFEKYSLVTDAFFRELTAATMGYRSILRNENLCTHYYMESIDIKIIELIEIGLNFYKQFLIKSRTVLGYEFFNLLIFNLLVIFKITQKITNRFTRIFQ